MNYTIEWVLRRFQKKCVRFKKKKKCMDCNCCFEWFESSNQWNEKERPIYLANVFEKLNNAPHRVIEFEEGN